MYKDYEVKLNAILDKHGVHKVDLALADNIQEQAAMMKFYLKDMDKAGKDFKKAKGRVELYTDGMPELKDAKKNILAAKKGAKDLGVDPNTIKGFKDLVYFVKEVENELKLLKKL